MTQEEYRGWFKKLYSGTTSSGKQELFAKNDAYSLVRIKHQGCGKVWGFGRSAGFTEWTVAINGEYLHGGHYKPKPLWGKEGRLSKEDRKHIHEKFKLYPNIVEGKLTPIII
jgi:hypothetical protein